MGGKILVGTASWSDPGFVSDWYPAKLPASERLPYYAQHFNFVELNSSFYGIPAKTQVRKWCEQTPPGFVFDVKLHKLLSRHSTGPESLPPEIRSKAEIEKGKVKLTPAIERAVASRFVREIEPFEEAGKLGALLLQLSPGFSPRSNNLEELDSVLGLFDGKKVAVELRNRGWMKGEHRPATEQFFRNRQVPFVVVDAPETEHFMAMPFVDWVTDPDLAYVRLHGRNVKGYVSGKTVAERFNYQYSEEELQEIAKQVEQISERARETHVVYNNNASDYAIKSAKRFQGIIKQAELVT